MDAKAKRAKYMREWRLRDLEGNQRKARERRKANPELARAWQAVHYEKHREAILADAKARREADPWHALMLAKTGSANRHYPGRLTVKDVEAVFEKGKRTCYYCGKQNLVGRDLTLEHLKPFNDVQCLAVSCSACNIARIQTRGPRKTKALLAQEARDRVRAWRASNRDKVNKRWWLMNKSQREERRVYMCEYMRKRRAAKKRRLEV